jgi:hypothetical protein
MSNAHIADSQAEEEYLSDIALFTEWLGDNCLRAKHVALSWVSDSMVDLTLRADSMSIPQLVALMLYPLDCARKAAVLELRRRYVAEFAQSIRERSADIERELDENTPDPDAWHDARVDAEMERA